MNENDQDRWQLELVAKFKAYHRFFEEKKKEEEKFEQAIKLKTKENEIKNERGRNLKSVPLSQKIGLNQYKAM